MNREIIAGAPWPIVRDSLPAHYELIWLSGKNDLEKLHNALTTQDLFDMSTGGLVAWLDDDSLVAPAEAMIADSSREIILATEKKLTGKHHGFTIKNQTLPSTPAALADWLTGKASALGGTISQEVISAITSAVDYKLLGWNDLMGMGTELAKMLAFSSDRHISMEVYQKMSAQGFSISIFEILRVMGKKDAKRAIILWEKLSHQGVGTDQLIPLFAGQIGNLLLAKSQGNGFPDVAEDKLGWDRRKAQAVSYEAKNFTLSELENALTKLLSIDIKRKTVSSDEESEMIGWLVENSTK